MKYLFLALALVLSPFCLPQDKPIDMLRPVVKIINGPFHGTGFVVYSKTQPNGKITTLILTCFHVVEHYYNSISNGTETESIFVYFHEFNERHCIKVSPEYYSELICINPKRDIALLVIETEKEWPHARILPDTSMSKFYKKCYSVGIIAGANGPHLSTGHIIDYFNYDYTKYEISIDSFLYMGMSGGPTYVKIHGKYYVIGINRAIFVAMDENLIPNRCYIVPCNYLIELNAGLEWGQILDLGDC